MRRLRGEHRPAVEPPGGSGAKIPLIDDTVFPNIGDRMSDAGVSLGLVHRQVGRRAGQPGGAPLFQYHHQPFNYFANYAPGTPGRAHLQDETKFFEAAQDGTLPTVSFVKPYGLENEHPGYASEPDGSDHLVDLLKAVTEGGQAGNTLVVVTYDEFGGQWDHVAAADGRQVGSGHPHPGAGDRPVVEALRRRPHDVRHDVDPGDHRAQPRARTAHVARRGGQRPGAGRRRGRAVGTHRCGGGRAR